MTLVDNLLAISRIRECSGCHLNTSRSQCLGTTYSRDLILVALSDPIVAPDLKRDIYSLIQQQMAFFAHCCSHE